MRFAYYSRQQEFIQRCVIRHFMNESSVYFQLPLPFLLEVDG
jgi:hypothetical protein